MCNYAEKDKDDLERIMDPDINKICYDLMKNGIIYDSQFHSFYSKLCKYNEQSLCDLFSDKTGLDIISIYDDITTNYVYFDRDKFDFETAIKKSRLDTSLGRNINHSLSKPSTQ